MTKIFLSVLKFKIQAVSSIVYIPRYIEENYHSWLCTIAEAISFSHWNSYRTLIPSAYFNSVCHWIEDDRGHGGKSGDVLYGQPLTSRECTKNEEMFLNQDQEKSRHLMFFSVPWLKSVRACLRLRVKWRQDAREIAAYWVPFFGMVNKS